MCIIANDDEKQYHNETSTRVITNQLRWCIQEKVKKLKVRINIPEDDAEPSYTEERNEKKIAVKNDRSETRKEKDLVVEVLDVRDAAVIEQYSLKTILYTSCVYICGLIIFIAIVTAIMAIFYFPYVR